jgi:hypothetical protein
VKNVTHESRGAAHAVVSYYEVYFSKASDFRVGQEFGNNSNSNKGKDKGKGTFQPRTGHESPEEE